MSEPEEKSPKCTECPHTEDQHDTDGFCEKEDGVLGFCKCPGYAGPDEEGAPREDPEPPPEGTGGEEAD
jgi:hypothetical protein